jgi:hypothetical protein
MTEPQLDAVIRLIDDANRQDPNLEVWQDCSYPKEYLYALRMTEWLGRLPALAHLSVRFPRHQGG